MYLPVLNLKKSVKSHAGMLILPGIPACTVMYFEINKTKWCAFVTDIKSYVVSAAYIYICMYVHML